MRGYCKWRLLSQVPIPCCMCQFLQGRIEIQLHCAYCRLWTCPFFFALSPRMASFLRRSRVTHCTARACFVLRVVFLFFSSFFFHGFRVFFSTFFPFGCAVLRVSGNFAFPVFGGLLEPIIGRQPTAPSRPPHRVFALTCALFVRFLRGTANKI